MAFKPADVPNLAGKVYLVTGGTAGLGAGTVSMLAAHDPAHIIFSGRNSQKADELIKQLKATNPDVPISFVQCDLADLKSVQAAASQILTETDRLDVLFANAGIMALPPSTTADGYEIQFGTNHLGHALLIKLLLPLLERTAAQPGCDVRIILTSSIAYNQAPKPGIVFDTLKSAQDGLGGMLPGGKWSRYGQSKLANILHAKALATRHPTITSVAVHPGYIKTDLINNTPFLTGLPVRFLARGNWTPVNEGHWNMMWAGTTPVQNLENGAYYVPLAKKGILETDAAKDRNLTDKLWDWTERELAPFQLTR